MNVHMLVDADDVHHKGAKNEMQSCSLQTQHTKRCFQGQKRRHFADIIPGDSAATLLAVETMGFLSTS